MSYDSRSDTLDHIREVREKLDQVIDDLLERSAAHDKSKLEEPELSVFNEFTPKLKNSIYGSDEYKGFLSRMGQGLQHHYAVNDHHPEHFYGGIRWMNMLQMIEMLCDWKAATLRHMDGNLRTSIEQNATRFGYGKEIENLLMRTADDLGWLT